MVLMPSGVDRWLPRPPSRPAIPPRHLPYQNNLVSPNEAEALAVDARQELDLRVGVSFTRFQTRFFQVGARESPRRRGRGGSRQHEEAPGGVSVVRI